MSDTTPTDEDIRQAVLALTDDQKVAVSEILTLVWRRILAAEADILETLPHGADRRQIRMMKRPVFRATNYAQAIAEAIRRDRAEEAEGVEQ